MSLKVPCKITLKATFSGRFFSSDGFIALYGHSKILLERLSGLGVSRWSLLWKLQRGH